MLKFILGVFVGGVIGFIICAICSMCNSEDENIEVDSEKTGDNDASGDTNR